MFFDSFFQPLTEEEESSYNDACSSICTRNKLGSFGNIQILGQDLKSLSPKAWLNDTIIDLFFTILDHQEDILVDDCERPKCLFMRTAFMHFLMSGGYSYSRVMRWTHDVDIFSFDKILIPVNVTNTHWFCMGVFPKKKGSRFLIVCEVPI